MELHAGTNAIIGPSDSGKTAIFRALRWVVENRPSGQDFHSWWKGDPAVTIELDSGIQITRSRVKSENLYYMFQEDGERDNPPQELEFKAFGQRVPEEVQRVLNLSPINFQWQMDSPFLLSQSSGEVAKYLNSVVNLESIDLALSNIERRVRTEKQDVELRKRRIEVYEQQIEFYDWLPEFEEELKKVEGLDREIAKLLGQITGLDEALVWLSDSQRKLREVESVLQWKGEVEELDGLRNEIDLLAQQAHELDELLDDIDTTEEELEQVTALTKLEGELNKLIELDCDIEDLGEDIQELSEALNQVGMLQRDILAHEDDLKRLSEQWDSLAPSICPLCGQSMPKKGKRRGN